MQLPEKWKLFYKNIILKLNSIVKWWFSKNTALKTGVLIFWTLWMLKTATLPQNQDFPPYQVPLLYVGGYFVLYFICTVVILFFNKRQTFKKRHNLKQPFNMQLIDTMTGTEFENFCAHILEKNGYQVVTQTKATGDQGVDIIAKKDNIKYAIQCKRYKNPVGNHSVMEVCSGKIYYGCNIGVVMTNSTFTPQAVEHAKKTGILLWDRESIKKMSLQYL